MRSSAFAFGSVRAQLSSAFRGLRSAFRPAFCVLCVPLAFSRLAFWKNARSLATKVVPLSTAPRPKRIKRQVLTRHGTYGGLVARGASAKGGGGGEEEEEKTQTYTFFHLLL